MPEAKCAVQAGWAEGEAHHITCDPLDGWRATRARLEQCRQRVVHPDDPQALLRQEARVGTGSASDVEPERPRVGGGPEAAEVAKAVAS